LTITDVSVRFPVASIAIARSRWVLEGHVSPEGAPLPPRSGILLHVLLYTSGAWPIIDSQNTDICSELKKSELPPSRPDSPPMHRTGRRYRYGCPRAVRCRPGRGSASRPRDRNFRRSSRRGRRLA
jgi:hypothetical protein